jgi:hypothetical protein
VTILWLLNKSAADTSIKKTVAYDPIFMTRGYRHFKQIWKNGGSVGKYMYELQEN